MQMKFSDGCAGIDVCRSRLQDRLVQSKSSAESAEIVEKLKKVEQELTVLKTSRDSQRTREGAMHQTGMPAPAVWT